ncbi:MAG: HAD family hydrolase [Sedimentisphaerales bacterium]|nr:HAD family hydrolase [Sedimentisphaerales bacterium]
MSNKAIFLDRDDTLIEDPGYISRPDQVKLLDGVDKSLIELKSMGYKLVVISNQSGVARGLVSEKALDEIHNRLKQLLAEKGAALDRIYYCPYHPDGVIEKYRKESDWRKPKPGMLLAAAGEMDIDLTQSWMLGNSIRDIEAGRQAGCKTILVNHPAHSEQHKLGEPTPDYRAINIKEAVNIIKKHHRSAGASSVQNQALPQTTPKPPPQAAAEPSRPQSETPKLPPAEQKTSIGFAANSRTDQILGSILEQLKSIRRNEMFNEFSITRFLAGVWQTVVWFCLLISIYFLMRPARQDNSVLITLGFALLFQVMALTFYIMHGRK